MFRYVGVQVNLYIFQFVMLVAVCFAMYPFFANGNKITEDNYHFFRGMAIFATITFYITFMLLQVITHLIWIFIIYECVIVNMLIQVGREYTFHDLRDQAQTGGDLFMEYYKRELRTLNIFKIYLLIFNLLPNFFGLYQRIIFSVHGEDSDGELVDLIENFKSIWRCVEAVLMMVIFGRYIYLAKKNHPVEHS